MPQPGTNLNLSTEDAQRLGGFLVDVLEDLETEHEPLFRSINRYWDIYEARPVSEHRTFPWENASNIVIPMARTWSDAIIARHFTRVLSPPQTWVGTTQNELFKDYLPAWLDFQNWAARGNIFDLFIPTWDWLAEMVPIGSAVLALNWVNRTQLRYAPGRNFRAKPVEVLASRGPVLEHVPRDQILWQPGSDIQSSDIVCRQRWMTRGELVRHALAAEWSKMAFEKVLAGAGDTESSHDNRREKDARAGYAGSDTIPFWDIREVWVGYPLLQAGSQEKVIPADDSSPDRPPVPIVATIHRPSGTVLRAITHPYFFPHWPFYDIHFRKRSGRGDSDGVCRMAEHLQRGTTTLANQSIDAITLANSVNFITRDRKFLDWKFAPNRPIVVNNLEDLKELNLSKQVTPDLALMNALIATGERLFSVGDPALGRETRLGGHPSPATSTLAMLEQMELNVGTSLRFVRNRLSQIGEDIATLFQQFELTEYPDDERYGRIEKAVGPTDARVIKEVLLPLDEPISGNVHFDLHAFSEVFNPEMERQKSVLVDQMLTNYYSHLLQLAQILDPRSPAGQNPMVRDIAIRAMMAKTQSMKRFLESTDFDTPEDVLANVQEAANDQRSLVDQAGGLLQRLGAAGGGAGSVPFGGVAGGPGGPNGAAGTPNGGFGSGL